MPFGLYIQKVMFFGLTNSPTTFQRMMDQLFTLLKLKYPMIHLILGHCCQGGHHKNWPHEAEWPCSMAKETHEPETSAIHVGDIWLPPSIYSWIHKHCLTSEQPTREECPVRLDWWMHHRHWQTHWSHLKWTHSVATRLCTAVLPGDRCISICHRGDSYSKGQVGMTLTSGKCLTCTNSCRMKLQHSWPRTSCSHQRTMSLVTHLLVITSPTHNLHQSCKPAVLLTPTITQLMGCKGSWGAG